MLSGQFNSAPRSDGFAVVRAFVAEAAILAVVLLFAAMVGVWTFLLTHGGV